MWNTWIISSFQSLTKYLFFINTSAGPSETNRGYRWSKFNVPYQQSISAESRRSKSYSWIETDLAIIMFTLSLQRNTIYFKSSDRQAEIYNWHIIIHFYIDNIHTQKTHKSTGFCRILCISPKTIELFGNEYIDRKVSVQYTKVGPVVPHSIEPAEQDKLARM